MQEAVLFFAPECTCLWPDGQTAMLESAMRLLLLAKPF